jgi:hypothetical protein
LDRKCVSHTFWTKKCSWVTPFGPKTRGSHLLDRKHVGHTFWTENTWVTPVGPKTCLDHIFWAETTPRVITTLLGRKPQLDHTFDRKHNHWCTFWVDYTHPVHFLGVLYPPSALFGRIMPIQCWITAIRCTFWVDYTHPVHFWAVNTYLVQPF